MKKLLIALLLVVVVVGVITQVKAEGGGQVYGDPAEVVLPGEGEVGVRVDAGEAGIAFARVELKFDPNVINLVEVQVGDELGVVIGQTGVETANLEGKVVVVLGLEAAQANNPPTGQFELFRTKWIPVTTTANVESEIEIDPVGLQIVDSAAQQVEMVAGNIRVKINPTMQSDSPTDGRAKLKLTSLNVPIQGGEWKIGIDLETSRVISGVDVKLKFKPEEMQFVKTEAESEWGNPALVEVSEEKGELAWSKTTEAELEMADGMRLTTLVFKVVGNTQVELGWDWLEGKVNESNVIELVSGRDILSQPEGLIKNVEAVESKLILSMQTAVEKGHINGILKEVVGDWESGFVSDESGKRVEVGIPSAWVGQIKQLKLKVPGYLERMVEVEVVAGENSKEIGKMLAGEINDDGIINNIDLALVYGNWFKSGITDFNLDGVTNSADHWQLITNFLQTSD